MKISLLAGIVALLSSPSLLAANYKVDITNLTHGTYFAPLLVATHNTDMQFFKAGMPASLNLQKMAEGGNFSGLAEDVIAAGGNTIPNPAAGPLMPGASISVDLGSLDSSHNHLSIIGMIVPTNDGFVALNNLALPSTAGTYTYYVNAYDAGTEANDEIRGSGMPGVPGLPVASFLATKVGTGGTGVPGVSVEGFVHIHRGIIGDYNSTGGTSDLNAATQRWLNPIGRIIVTVE